MSIALITTTYNWPQALDAVLATVKQQSLTPQQVIIADDGSTSETAELVNSWQNKLDCPLIHCWQEDQGFRAARARNLALSRVSADYVVLIDGDMLLPKHFLKQHWAVAQAGQFVQASRMCMNEPLSKQVIANGRLPHFFSFGLSNRKNLCQWRPISRFLSQSLNSVKRTRSCNMAFWYQDAVKVNGFNHAFTNWGYEDTEFTQRMLNSGLHRLYVKCHAAAFHIYHPQQSRQAVQENQRLFQLSKQKKLLQCEHGLRQLSSQKQLDI